MRRWAVFANWCVSSIANFSKCFIFSSEASYNFVRTPPECCGSRDLWILLAQPVSTEHVFLLRNSDASRWSVWSYKSIMSLRKIVRPIVTRRGLPNGNLPILPQAAHQVVLAPMCVQPRANTMISILADTFCVTFSSASVCRCRHGTSLALCCQSGISSCTCFQSEIVTLGATL